ncbi:hypothetical protein G647_05547 [Cladophialophora carrionii CBS 160.54]|uniref:Peptide N-acetyl-beta-D-glucosaminyl asparaginase amidase A N-terminal domain-containing protein n=1 Tax=Cladophialophora carrionii CBS 160.54 TaxID=1279043 RepID=V9DCP7_9EURO|nr:uncharacterized protein G647_05547 [Cladophialophora carrionii CBS 160.54]ETI23742.1 hypothetical protein G647_05547 [Cladophialophora carrionii CBS 160.54]
MRVLEGAVAAAAATSSVLRVFQVSPPLLAPPGVPQNSLLSNEQGQSVAADFCKHGCFVTQTLMVHSFANSYGDPFIGSYTPPECSFNHITLNLTVEAAGRQFDRLAVAYLGDVEIWRTSTAEPTRAGIIWTHVKDVSYLLSLFLEPQQLVFDLGNLINENYTSPFNVTLEATFFQSSTTTDPADIIVSVPARRSAIISENPSHYPHVTVGDSIVLPRNVERAVFTIAATGQMDEEFWYSNVFSSYTHTFGRDPLPGHSPFREIQLLIDGQLAGVVWPFPIVFTGGIVPGLWRPVVGIDAFDIREDEIDITPWLPLLCDGESHVFEIRVVGIDDDGKGKSRLSETVGSYWVITGKIFIWLDQAGSVTAGTIPTLLAPVPSLALFSELGLDSNGTNQTLTNVIDVTRNLSISSQVETSKGIKTVSWRQSLTYSNWDYISDFGVRQTTTQHINGSAVSSEGYSRVFSYPLCVNSTVIEDKAAHTLFISATINRGQEVEVYGQLVFPTGLEPFNRSLGFLLGDFQRHEAFVGSRLSTTQNGSAIYSRHENVSTSPATTQQDLTFSGIPASDPEAGSQRHVELYRRHVIAVNDTLVEDRATLHGSKANLHLSAKSNRQDMRPVWLQ